MQTTVVEFVPYEEGAAQVLSAERAQEEPKEARELVRMSTETTATIVSKPTVEETIVSKPTVQETIVSKPTVENAALSHSEAWEAAAQPGPPSASQPESVEIEVSASGETRSTATDSSEATAPEGQSDVAAEADSPPPTNQTGEPERAE
jgi:hypothetical protein